jgi:hypothetical protein
MLYLLFLQSRLREDMKNVRQYDTLDPIECLELHLRAIVLETYEGKRPDVNFAKFFVLNAKVLELMKFGVNGNTYNENWMANQHRWLQLDNKASRDAQFDFRRDCGSYCFHYNKHIHDMWMPDPFDSSLCKCCQPVQCPFKRISRDRFSVYVVIFFLPSILMLLYVMILCCYHLSICFLAVN